MRGKRKARAVAEFARKEGWDVVLLSELWAERDGVVWMGDDEHRVVFVHSRRAGVLLRGELMKAWIEGGMVKKVDERHVTVKVRGLVMTASYMPVWVRGKERDVEAEWEVLLQHVEWARRRELTIVGGDFNAHVGGGEARRGVCGRFGMRTTNEAGRRMLEWCEENGMEYVNSFYQRRKRGSWWSAIHRRWYELDGFLMRGFDRRRHVRKIGTVDEASLSDHKPVRLRVDLKKRRWRVVREKKKVPKIRWERLQVDAVAEEYRELMEVKMREYEEERRGNVGELGEMSGWPKFAEVVVEGAKEVCGVREKKVENPWMIGREEEVDVLRREITVCVERRNEEAEKERRGQANQVVGARGMLKEARNELRRRTRRWEREYWNGLVKECKDAEGVNDVGGLYRGLRKLGLRGMKSDKRESKVTTEGFRRQFEGVS